MINLKFSISCIVLVIICSSCSGGGGGDGGGSSTGGRTTNTAIRLINGSIDSTPFSVRLEDRYLQTARFNELTDYISVGAGSRNFIVERSNSPTVSVANLAAVLEKNTEYTIFIYGEQRVGGLKVELLRDQVVRPEVGKAFLKVLNSRLGEKTINVTDGEVNLSSVGFGKGSEFREITSGIKTFVVTDQDDNTIARLVAIVEDRSEVTLLVTGSKDLGVTFTQVYNDLD